MGFLEMAMERDHMGWEVQFLWQSWWFRGANVYGQSIASSHGLGGSKQKCEHILVHYIYIPIGSMYGIYANIGGILMVNVTIYGIHGSYGIYICVCAWVNVYHHKNSEIWNMSRNRFTCPLLGVLSRTMSPPMRKIRGHIWRLVAWRPGLKGDHSPLLHCDLPVIKHGNWKSTKNEAFNGKINYKVVIFHCHVW